MKIKLKEVAIIIAVACLVAVFYNSILIAGVPYLYQEEKVANGSVVSLEQAREMVGNPDILFIDARSESSYKVAHLPGAINVPYSSGEIKKLMAQIKKDQSIVIYCYSKRCNMARALASKLSAQHYSSVAVFDDGISVWTKNNFPIESSIKKDEQE